MIFDYKIIVTCVSTTKPETAKEEKEEKEKTDALKICMGYIIVREKQAESVRICSYF